MVASSTNRLLMVANGFLWHINDVVQGENIHNKDSLFGNHVYYNGSYGNVDNENNENT